MSEQAIIERIIQDAEQEAEKIVAEADKRAAETIEQASLKADRNRLGTQAEVNERAKAISDGKAASARLDGAKILLAEKRGVIDEIYSRALKKLVELGKAETVHLAEKLLSEYAEEGDEIVFAENFRFAREVASLPVVKENNLKVSAKTCKADGGFVLRGKISDKDISYGALLAADRERFQTEIATKIFN